MNNFVPVESKVVYVTALAGRLADVANEKIAVEAEDGWRLLEFQPQDSKSAYLILARTNPEEIAAWSAAIVRASEAEMEKKA